MVIGNIDEFKTKITKVGGSLVFTVPKLNKEYSELKEGQLVKVYYKKINSLNTEDYDQKKQHVLQELNKGTNIQ